MARYFNVSFSYQGPCVNIIGEDEASNRASDACQKADHIVTDTLKGASVRFKHAYAWPDGSLYKYVMTDLDQPELRQQLNKLFENSEVSISTIYESKPEDDPWKCGIKTVAEYFEEKPV